MSGAGAGRAPRFAVVLKAAGWDGFVQRQAARCAALSTGGDFFVTVDGAAGPAPEAGWPVLPVHTADLLRLGLPDRAEHGKLLWWNADYPHYSFARQQPGYDFYVFVEYDVVCTGALAALVGWAAQRGADVVTLPIATAQAKWFWTLFHRQTYSATELRASLNCLTVFSRRALDVLAERRRAMAADPAVRYWPSSEAFIATEAERAGLRVLPLGEYGDVSRFDWFPPTLEEDLPGVAAAGPAFLHPVLDQARYIASVLRSAHSVASLLHPRSGLRLRLARFPPESYRPKLAGASVERLRRRAWSGLRRARLLLSPGALVPDRR